MALAEDDDSFTSLKSLMVINLLRSCVSCRIKAMFENVQVEQNVEEEADYIPTEEEKEDTMQRMPTVSVKLALRPN
jgi:hypothetical protein